MNFFNNCTDTGCSVPVKYNNCLYALYNFFLFSNNKTVSVPKTKILVVHSALLSI